MELQKTPSSQFIIYFDGVCGLCNGFIDFVMSVDKQKKFLFSPLQSDYAKAHLPPEATRDLSSIVVHINGKTLTKSQAVFEVLKNLGGAWSLLSIGQLLPTPFSNWGYDLIAQNRYKLFGKKESCRLPTPEERARFVL